MSNSLFQVDQVPTAAAIPAPLAANGALKETHSQPITARPAGQPSPSPAELPAGDRQRAWHATPPRTPKVSAADFLVEDKPPRPWPPSMGPLVTFLEFGGDALPTAPFHFRPGEFVFDPALFLEKLRADVARGPDGPRARLGTLQRDLRQLRALFGRRRRIIPPEITAARPPQKPR